MGRKKKAKICDKVSLEDRISQLPEHLISEILCHLPTNYAVRTSALSTKSRPVLQLRDLSRLNVIFSKSDLEMLPTLLESCPKLEYFVFELVRDRFMRGKKKKKKEAKVMFSTVPQCLVSSLKFVEWKRSMSGYEGDLELVRYLLKNSKILEKLRLDTYYAENAKCDFLKELLTMPRCSSVCEIHCSFIPKDNYR